MRGVKRDNVVVLHRRSSCPKCRSVSFPFGVFSVEAMLSRARPGLRPRRTAIMASEMTKRTAPVESRLAKAARTGRGASARSRPPAPTTTPPRKRHRTETRSRLRGRSSDCRVGCDQTSFMRDRPERRARRAGAAAAKLRWKRGRAPIGPPQRRERGLRSPSRVSTRSFYSLRGGPAIELCLRAVERNFGMRVLARLVPALALVAAAPAAAPPPPRGFFPDTAVEQQRVEREFRAVPDPAGARENMRRLSAVPHHLGSSGGRDNAQYVRARFKEYGLDAHIETFDVLFPTPRARVVALVEPLKFRAALSEPVLREDPTSNQTALQLPTYNAYSIDGDVTAPLVYVNFGVPDDYEKLERLGVDVKGKIVIARYGGGWRGIKPKVAAEKGAVGCIIYSDPRDDGFFEGEVYPKGAFRPEQGVQRGSVADMPIHSGDPLTPGVGATKDARRLERENAATITKIPVLPIGYGDARPLLAALEGPVAPEGWRGGLPITYRIGPGPANVHLKLAFDWKIVPAHDVVARIPGSVWPNEWIVRGNHHDAWVNGAEDPISGLVAML